jgi:hypothetical protein
MNHTGFYRSDGGNTMEKKKQVRKVVPQDWDLPAKANVPYKIWRVLFAAIKIASGALATVLLIVVVAGFVFVGMLGDFLQNDVGICRGVDDSGLIAAYKQIAVGAEGTGKKIVNFHIRSPPKNQLYPLL